MFYLHSYLVCERVEFVYHSLLFIIIVVGLSYYFIVRSENVQSYTCICTIELGMSVLQRRLKMDQRQIWRFFGFWKWTKDEHKESSLIQIFFGDCKFFEYLRRCEYFQRKMEYSYKRQLEQILSAEELYIFWEKLNFKVLNF